MPKFRKCIFFRFSSSCIHVTALLFQIEAANRNVLTNVACTSKPCQWNVPQKKTEVKPMKIADMKWKAAKLNKEPSRPLCDVRQTLFEPVEPKQKEEKSKRRKLYMGLKDIIPNACFLVVSDAVENEISTSTHTLTSTSISSSSVSSVILAPTSIATGTPTTSPLTPLSTSPAPTPFPSSTSAIPSTPSSSSMVPPPPTPNGFTHESISTPVPPDNKVNHVAVPNLNLENTILKHAASASSTEEFLSSIKPINQLTEVHAIEIATVRQANNPIWSDQRNGRITASNFYRVFTRMETIKSSTEGSVDSQNLVDHLLGCNAPPNDI